MTDAANEMSSLLGVRAGELGDQIWNLKGFDAEQNEVGLFDNSEIVGRDVDAPLLG